MTPVEEGHPAERVRGSSATKIRAWLRTLTVNDVDDTPTRSLALTVIVGAICLGTLALVAFGYVATREWRRTIELLAAQRTAEAVALASSAVTRDMRGAWTALIVPINELSIAEEPPYNLFQPVARALARFPYPESVLIWKAGDHASDVGRLYVLNRTDRPPAWELATPSTDPFPVRLSVDSPALLEVVRTIRQRGGAQPFIFANLAIGGIPYQVVAHLFFSPDPPHELVGVAAFTVNLAWVRAHYFEPLLFQLAKVGGSEDAFVFSVLDDAHSLVATTGRGADRGRGRSRSFPLLFLDSALVTLPPQGDADASVWTVSVAQNTDTTLGAAQRSADRTLALLTLAAVVSLVALAMTVRALRAGAALASMKSDFVATVTHELKTPVACIRLVGDTLSQERYTSPEVIRDYAKLLSEEALRLGRTVDQLLLYARHSAHQESQDSSFVLTCVRDLIDGALEPFRPALEHLGFDVVVDAPEPLPHVRVERAAMVHAIENIIDNAIKYSDTTRALRILARRNAGRVEVSFADRGVGISAEDLPHVCERFYRGRNTQRGGSGLGLAIASRIIRSHGGSLALHSTVARGTDVVVTLPGVERS